LHVAWLLCGLFCHSFECERWKTGCGECPYLTVWKNVKEFPGDGTAQNWKTKRAIYARCRVHVTTACRWMMNKVEQSMLAPGVASSRIIPYGVDRTLFRPAEDRQAVRAAMDIPEDARVFFFVARFLKTNPSKDYQTLRSAIELMAKRGDGRRVIVLARGAAEPSTEALGNIEVRYVPWEDDGRDVVR
jgi:glycosyltransferase involved in cell wall biosynthesis